MLNRFITANDRILAHLRTQDIVIQYGFSGRTATDYEGFFLLLRFRVGFFFGCAALTTLATFLHNFSLRSVNDLSTRVQRVPASYRI
jgi:hypothetical protein